MNQHIQITRSTNASTKGAVQFTFNKRTTFTITDDQFARFGILCAAIAAGATNVEAEL